MNDVISYLKKNRTKTSYTLLAAPERFHNCTISILNPLKYTLVISSSYIYTLILWIHTIPPTLKNTPLWIIRKPHKHLPSNHRTFLHVWIIFVNENSLSGITWNALLWIILWKRTLSWNAHLWIIIGMAPLVINLLVLRSKQLYATLRRSGMGV